MQWGFWLRTMRFGAAYIFGERGEGQGKALVMVTWLPLREARLKRNEPEKEREGNTVLRYKLTGLKFQNNFII